MNTPVLILYLEDNLRDAELVQDLLRQSAIACEVRIVIDRVEYEHALEQTRFDLILADYSLPGYDGMTALALAREKQPYVPFILVTGTLGEEQAVDCVLNGVTDFVLKHRLSRLVPAALRALIEAEERNKRREVESDLRESELRYRNIFENSVIGISHAFPDGSLIRVNQSYAKMYGYANPSHVLSESPNVSSRYADSNKREHVLQTLNEHGVIPPTEVTVVHRDGSHFVVLAAAREIRDASGKLLFFQAEHVDITDRIRAEEAQRNSETRYRALFDSSADGIIIADSETKRIQLTNPTMCQQFGYSCEEMRALNIFDLHAKEAWSQLLAKLDVLTRGEKIFKTDIPCIRKDKTIFDADINGTAISLDGKLHFVAFYHDISERKKAEEQRLVFEERIRQQQRLETVGQLGAGIAHDFNNLLTGINGFTHFAQDSLPEGAPARENLDEVLTLAKRATELTRQLLAFSRKQTLQPIIFNINQHISNMMKMLGRLIGENIDLQFHPAADQCFIKADLGQIEQVVINLAVNSRDAMPDGGKLIIETANVELDDNYAHLHFGTSPGSYIMLAVSDNGCGIDKSLQDRIFEPFFTTKEIGKGTGLGLATVYGIVKQHGGSIWVYSELGRGSCFKIYLPRVSETIEITTTSIPIEQAMGTETILVVEDADAVREVAARILRQQGYHVLTAALPSQAEGILADHGDHIDLLLTDMVMPQRSGRQLYESALIGHPKLRAIFMSGYTDTAALQQGLLDATIPFLQKPFTKDTLLSVVYRVLHSE